jgi:hypothetical protein
MAWINDLEDVQGFRESIGAPPGAGSTMQRHLARAQHDEAAAMRADAQRAEQAEGEHAQRALAMLAESGFSSFAELSRFQAMQRAQAEQRYDRDEAERKAEVAGRAQDQLAARYAKGDRPKPLAEIFQSAALFS